MRPCPPLNQLADLELCYIAACSLGRSWLAKRYLEENIILDGDREKLAIACMKELRISVTYDQELFKASKVVSEDQCTFLSALTPEKAVLMLVAKLANYSTLPNEL